MSKFELFKEVLMMCWADREDDIGYRANLGRQTVYVSPHWSDDGECLLWVVLEDENGQEIRGDSIYAEGFDDEHFQVVFKYITTGEEY